MIVCSFAQHADAKELFDRLNKKFPDAHFKSAYEAGFCGFSVHYALTELGFENIVVHAADIPTTGKEKALKTDAVDSEKIAWALKRDELTGIYIKDWIGHLMRSHDGGRSWGEPEKLGRYQDGSAGFAYLGAVKNKPVMAGRRLIAPSSDESVRWQIHFEVSEDGGKHWTYVRVPSADTIVSIQPAILKHRDGTLQALCRTKNGYLSTTYSHDGGLSWEPELLTDIPNNNSGIDCETLSNGLFAMVYNPAGKERGKEFGPRTPLVLAFSADGLHWHDALTLEEGDGEFSYPSIVESNGALHIVYTWNRKKIKYVRVELHNLYL